MLTNTEVLQKLQGRHFDVSYLSSDNLFHPLIRTGAGGLGVVQGSIAAELENNYERHQMTALFVGFYCSHGYQTQRVNEYGVMESHYEKNPHPEMVLDTGVRFSLTLHGRECVCAIKVPVDTGREHTAIILLDTDIPENNNAPDLQMITRVLYGEKHATQYFSEEHEPWKNIEWMRILQAAVLGLGSFYAMKTLSITSDFVHCNDSHPVFYFQHLLGLFMQEGMGFEDALKEVRKVARFTNHTILESGNKHYSIGDIAQVAGHYAGFDEETLRYASKDHVYWMTTAALNLVGPGHANTVSKDHNRIAQRLFDFPSFFPITNGVYVPKYQHPAFAALERPEEIPEIKQVIKAELYDNLVVRAEAAGWPITNANRDEWGNSTLITWARRCQGYKRPGLMWNHSELEFVKMLLEWRMISVAWGGFVHPDDTEMSNRWNEHFRLIRELPNVMPVFNYDFELMRPLLKAGSNIWLNTPQFGFEACGTSWMSAMLNGALVVSVMDGGVLEAEHVIPFGSTTEGEYDQQYAHDARELWKTLYSVTSKIREKDPRMLQFLFDGMKEAEENFSATRMVDEYRTKLWR